MPEGTKGTKIAIDAGTRFVTATTQEPEEQLWMRRAAAHPGTTIDRWSWCEDPGRGTMGGRMVVRHVFVPNELLMDDQALSMCGDAGGAGDRLIAEVARKLTGLTDPEDVAHHLARAELGGSGSNEPHVIGAMPPPSRIYRPTEEQGAQSPTLAGCAAMGWTEEQTIERLWRDHQRLLTNHFKLAAIADVPSAIKRDAH